jgi:hypothetical protein
MSPNGYSSEEIGAGAVHVILESKAPGFLAGANQLGYMVEPL